MSLKPMIVSYGKRWCNIVEKWVPPYGFWTVLLLLFILMEVSK